MSVESGQPFIDVDEWRDVPCRFRYLHGGFEGSSTRFSLYFPDASNFSGRFLQYLQGGAGGNERSAGADVLQLAFDNGMYLIESNQGHINNPAELADDLSVLLWRASARSAEYGREMADAMYGGPPDHGFLLGGSGGAVRAFLCIQARPDLWQGAVPFMINQTGLFAFNASLFAWTMLVLGGDVDRLVDATRPGSEIEPVSAMSTADQVEALQDLYQAGYPRGAEDFLTPGPDYLFLRSEKVLESYTADFWTKPGFEGHDDHPVIAANRIEHQRARVTAVLTARQLDDYGPLDESNLENAALSAFIESDRIVGFALNLDVAGSRLVNARVRVLSGAASGRVFYITGARGEALSAMLFAPLLEGIAAGDELEFDNGDYLAFAALHRHVEDLGYPETRQIAAKAAAQGRPLLTFEPSMAPPGGGFEGKVILLQHLHDVACPPSVGRAFVEDLKQHLGDRLDDSFRLWWIDNAAHLPAVTKRGEARAIAYCYGQALHHLIDWVEHGTPPPASTSYRFTPDNALILAGSAAERLGIQPVVQATANDGAVAHAHVGDAVRLVGVAEAPPGAGAIVKTEWDPEGVGEWPLRTSHGSKGAAPSRPETKHEAAHAYAEPGVYFASFRATSNKDDRANSLYDVTNIARVRVIIERK